MKNSLHKIYKFKKSKNQNLNKEFIINVKRRKGEHSWWIICVTNRLQTALIIIPSISALNNGKLYYNTFKNISRSGRCAV